MKRSVIAVLVLGVAACAANSERRLGNTRSGTDEDFEDSEDSGFVESILPIGAGWWCYSVFSDKVGTLGKPCSRSRVHCESQREETLRGASATMSVSDDCESQPKVACYTAFNRMREGYLWHCSANFSACEDDAEYTGEEYAADYRDFSNCVSVGDIVRDVPCYTWEDGETTCAIDEIECSSEKSPICELTPSDTTACFDFVRDGGQLTICTHLSQCDASRERRLEYANDVSDCYSL